MEKLKMNTTTREAPHKKHKRTKDDQFKFAAAGGSSAVITRSLCQPLDVLKIRFQLQVEPLNHGQQVSKYRSIHHAVRTIIKEEGVLALWKGHNPAQVLSLMYGVAQFWTYERLNLAMKDLNYLGPNRNARHFVCGTLAGGMSTFVTTPFDVVRTRLIAQDNKRGYPNTFRAIGIIIQKEGVVGLYRGLLPAMMSVGPLTGCNFMLYRFLGNIAGQLLDYPTDQLPSYIQLANGALAGLGSKTITYPLDLTKKRLQIQGFSEYRKTYGKFFECSGIYSCLSKTVKTEGFLGLFKGMGPSTLKAGVTTALHFCLYDQILRLLMTTL